MSDFEYLYNTAGCKTWSAKAGVLTQKVCPKHFSPMPNVKYHPKKRDGFLQVTRTA